MCASHWLTAIRSIRDATSVPCPRPRISFHLHLHSIVLHEPNMRSALLAAAALPLSSQSLSQYIRKEKKRKEVKEETFPLFYYSKTLFLLFVTAPNDNYGP